MTQPYVSSIQFNAAGGYNNPNAWSTFEARSHGRFAKLLVDTLRLSKMDFEMSVPADGLDFSVKRFGFKMVIELRGGAHGKDVAVVYGYTEPTNTIEPETKLFISRICGFRHQKSLPQIGTIDAAYLRYDTLVVRNDRLARKHLKTPRSVIRYMECEQAFGHLVKSLNEVTNLSGTSTAGYVAFALHDIDVEKVSDRLMSAITNVSKEQAVNPCGLDEGDAEFLAHMSDRFDSVNLDNTQFGQELNQKTNFRYDGFVTCQELQDIFGFEAIVVVADDMIAHSFTKVPDEINERIFHDYMKKLAVWASERGLENAQIGMSADKNSTITDFSCGRYVFPNHQFRSNSIDDFEGDTLAGHAILPGGELLLNTTPVVKPMEARDIYGVEQFSVKIDLDFFGEIVGKVSVNGGEEQTFVLPAFALAEVSGMFGTERSMKKLTELYQHHIRQAQYPEEAELPQI